MVGPTALFVRVGRLAVAVDQRISARASRRAAVVVDRLFRGDQIMGVDAVFDAEGLAAAVRPAQRHRGRRGQLRAGGRPQRGWTRHLDALRRPAEAGEIGGLGAGGREQADGGRILGDGLALFGQRYVVDARAGQVDRSEEHTSELQSLMRISYAVFCFQQQNINLLPTKESHTLIQPNINYLYIPPTSTLL